ncbi:transcriptional repressor [Echinicola sp. 20G]|uniref:transcriptional repressor n=1 Tax=Echinicola sp. 20G TaxID=2781961 RepID=UPI00190FCE5F
MGNTIAKKKIHKIIRESRHPITYGDIKKQIDGACSRVTIYRILLQMEKDRVVIRFPDANGDFRYVLCQEKDNPYSEHSHFHCLQCNTICCIEANDLKAFIPTTYMTHSISFLAAGICPNCASSGAVQKKNF